MGLLRSKCHPAKIYFKKINKNQIKCSLGCSADETQIHIFEECQPILDLIGESKKIKLHSVFGTLEDQKSVITRLMHIEALQVDLIKTLTQNKL